MADEPFRLRMKVLTQDGERFLRPMGAYSPSLGKVWAYAMNDRLTHEVNLSAEEWNALPYHYFEDAGVAPRPEHRTVTLPDKFAPRPKEPA